MDFEMLARDFHEMDQKEVEQWWGSLSLKEKKKVMEVWTQVKEAMISMNPDWEPNSIEWDNK